MTSAGDQPVLECARPRRLVRRLEYHIPGLAERWASLAWVRTLKMNLVEIRDLASTFGYTPSERRLEEQRARLLVSELGRNYSSLTTLLNTNSNLVLAIQISGCRMGPRPRVSVLRSCSCSSLGSSYYDQEIDLSCHCLSGVCLV
jgi:hypothetical protein